MTIHSKRTRMTTDDVNKAAKLCRLQVHLIGINLKVILTLWWTDL